MNWSKTNGAASTGYALPMLTILYWNMTSPSWMNPANIHFILRDDP